MFEYTFKNHFQFGYQRQATGETRWLADRIDPDEIFVARYGTSQTTLPSWREANRLAAHEVIAAAKKSGLRPTICYSGGIDSEVTLLSFLEALKEMPTRERINIDVVTLCDENGLNSHDVAYVDRFKETHEIRRQSSLSGDHIDLVFSKFFLDFEKFFKRPDLERLVETSQMLSPILNAHLSLLDQVLQRSPKALLVIGQGELYLARSDNDSKPFFGSVEAPSSMPLSATPAAYGELPWSAVETENLCGLYKYFLRRKLPAVPGFFQYLPEQFETQLRTNPVLRDLISNRRLGKLGTRSSKAEIIAFDYPELEPRPKFTGFEKLEPLHDEIRLRLSRRLPHLEAKWSLPVAELQRTLTAKDRL